MVPNADHVWNIGRQSGKDLMLSGGAVHNAGLRPDLDQVLPSGMTRDVLVACPRRPGAKSHPDRGGAHRGLAAAAPHARGPVRPRPLHPAAHRRRRQAVHREDPDLGLPANARTTRGHRASMVIFNEQGFLMSLVVPAATRPCGVR